MILKMYMFYMTAAKKLGGTVAQAAAFYLLVRLIIHGAQKVQEIIKPSDEEYRDY